jgi:hypothetical protein
MTNGVIWDVRLCGSSKNRKEYYQPTHAAKKYSVRRLLGTASVVAISQILVTLMNKGLNSSETSVPTRATRRNIPQGAIITAVKT